MYKTVFTFYLFCIALSAQTSAQAINPVVQWNRNLLAIVRTPGVQPATIHPTRSFAIMHAAMYGAVETVKRTRQNHWRHIEAGTQAIQDAAANAAAYQVLIALYPALRSTLDVEFQQSLAPIPHGDSKREGMRLGREVADEVLALRSNDGSNASPVPFVFGTAPGDYQSTPPNFPPQPQLTHWAGVTPFVLREASQFRPGPPPALNSERYSKALNEVESVGNAVGATATADQALTGKFWNGAIQNYWNEIAQTASIARGLTIAQSARLFAILNLSIADSVIAFYDAKYTYNFWRPVTAIRTADPNETPDALPNSSWLPEVGKTTPDPSYPGAHAVVSSAAAFVLRSFFDDDSFEYDVTSEVLPGIQRHFTSFSAAAQEASRSRIFAGVHFLFDLTSGARLGRDVADFAVDRLLENHHLRRDRDHDEDEDAQFLTDPD